MPGRILDSILEIPAPEFIVFRARTAGPVARFLAVLLDHIIIFAAMLGITFGLTVFSIAEMSATQGTGFSMFLLMIAFFVLQWFYFFLWEWLSRGRTPGKMAVGLRVISMDGTSLDSVQILIRNLLRIADMFPIKFVFWLFYVPTYAAGFVSLFFTGPRFRRLGDLAAGTIVVREEMRAREKALRYPVPEEVVRRLAFKVMPSATLAQALHDFASRYDRMHPARRAEIAERARERLEWITGKQDCSAEDLLLACHHKLTQTETQH